MFEPRHRPLASKRQFLGRVLVSCVVGLFVILSSLLFCMVGYRYLEAMGWLDAFLNAAMLLSGMGPIATPQTQAGKLFAGCYALYSGFVVLIVAGIIFAPVVHRLFHLFHLENINDSI